MNTEFSTYAEHTVKRATGRYAHILKPTALILDLALAVVFGLILSALAGAGIGLLATVLVAVLGLCFHARLFRTVEYDYRITEGELYFSEVYNGRRRKELFTLKIADFEMIAPYRDPHKASADRVTFDEVHDFSSSTETPDLYFGIYHSEDTGKRTLFLFEPSQKFLRLLAFYNRRTVVTKLSSSEEPIA